MGLKDIKAKSDAALASIPDSDVKPSKVNRPVTSPGAAAFMQPTIDALNERTKTAEALVKEYERRLAEQPTELPLDLLVEVPNRKRHLTTEEFAELRENLRHHPLMHPVVVRKLPDGRFEVISGGNRIDAYRALGRKSIEVIVKDIDEALVDRVAFYVNLMQPALPDFEKYMGFRHVREQTGLSGKDLARDAGVPESTISMLFAFEDLPTRAIEWISQRPSAIGMACVAELAKNVRAGREESVIEAVRLLVSGKLTQKEAVALAGRIPRPGAAGGAVVKPVKIRAGRLDFCQYLGKGSSLRIEFKDEAHRLEAEERISAVLREMAEEARN